MIRSAKKILLFITCMAGAFVIQVDAQTAGMEQLKQQQNRFEQTKDFLQDTAYLNILNRIAFLYATSAPDSALMLLQNSLPKLKAATYQEGEADCYKIRGTAFQTKGNYAEALKWYEISYTLAEKIRYKAALPGILNNIGMIYFNQGNYDMALDKFYKTLHLADDNHNDFVKARTLNNIATVRFYQGNLKEAETGYKQTLLLQQAMSDTMGIILSLNNIAEINIEEKKLRESLQHLMPAYQLAVKKNMPDMLVVVTQSLGNTYLQMDSAQKAIGYFETALRIARQKGFGRSTCKALIGLAKAYKAEELLQPALTNGLEGLHKAEELRQTQLQRDANEIVAAIYEAMGNTKEGLIYFKKFKIFSDSLTSVASQHVAANYKANYEFAKKEQVLQRKNLQQQWIAFSALAAFVVLGIILMIVNRNKQRLNNTYKELQHKNIVIELHRTEVEKTLTELKAAQAQLIQAEKMASLGEMAAGIAHEIQNPLNFVNNFSEVSNELIDEMGEEVKKSNFEEVKAIAEDLKLNLQKINLHGKRAEAIVTGMLQHARRKQGVKEPTDINALCNEYLRLTYHGLRAQDKEFNVAFTTRFDETIGKINMIPQDVARVLINLFNNAFYAVHEKRKLGYIDYQPRVSVETKDGQREVEIKVEDNGSGIPQAIIDKIFQPFFTTKPSGQGTGLGLSISYDIIKTQGGEIKAESREGEESTFIITLPKV